MLSQGSFTLTVGIPWNGTGDIKAALVKAQLSKCVNAIVISPSSSVAYSRSKYASTGLDKVSILPPGDIGLYSAYRKIINACVTSHLVFHGADDMVNHTTLLPIDGLMEISDSIIICSLLILDPYASRTKRKKYNLLNQDIELGRYASPATPEVLYPVKILKAINAPSLEYKIAGDADMFFSAKNAASDVRCLDIDFSTMRYGGLSTLPSRSILVFYENLRISKKFNQVIPLSCRTYAFLFLFGRYILFRILGDQASLSIIAIFSKTKNYLCTLSLKK